jgi:hypothetical protein
MPPEQGQPALSDHNISIWGAPGSGKTTFLAALNIALILKEGPWRVIGADGPSRDFLIEMTSALSQHQRFPDATLALGHYKWFLSRQPEKKGRSWWFGRKPSPRQRIGLDVLDAPGGFYRANRTGSGTDREELLSNLERSRGIVYLFDPIREFNDGDAFNYLHGVLTDLAGRMLAKDRFADDMLPHHLAVCVTKFDELRILETAEKLGLLAPDPDDPHGFPRIDDDYAEELFQQLCGVSATGNAKMVVPALKQFFRPERIKFFVTSSIGFYLDPAKGVYDPDDPQNLLPEAPRTPGDQRGTGRAPAGKFRIRGPAHPINVMEPMLWLGQRMSSDRQSGEAGG